MNTRYYRQTALAAISSGIAKIRALDALKHNYLRGRIREVFVKDILTAFTPTPFAVTNGKIIDWKGNESSEIDVIVYLRDPLPHIPIDREIYLIPAEAVIYAFEIKTRLELRELKKTATKYANMRALNRIVPGDSGTWKSNKAEFCTCLISFHANKTKSLIDVYMAVDKERPPAIKVFLTPQEYFYWGSPPSNPATMSWVIGAPENTFEANLFNFLTGYANTLINILQSPKRFPPIGYYLHDVDDPWGLTK
jgi:hypothetical protein